MTIQEAKYIFIATVIYTIFFVLILIGVANAQTVEVDGVEYTYEQVADAIFHAEGGKGYDYGIKSVKYKDEADARQICINTIRNNVRRYDRYGYSVFASYIEFLASRYAPTTGRNLSEAERRLNPNWIKNVCWFLKNPKEVK